MRVEKHTLHVDAEIAALAARQHGVVSHPQLVSLGLSRQAIDRRVRAGRLHRVHRAVYAVGHRRLTQSGRWMAAVLTGGSDAHLSHRAAAAHWQILPCRGSIHVTTPRRLRERDGIAFHYQSLQFDEVTEHDGIPVTTVARTLLDVAATEPMHLERAFNEAEFRRLWDATGVAQLVQRHRGRAGCKALAALLTDPSMGRTREELEHRFHALVEKSGLPRPLCNHDIELEPGRWIQADCAWPDSRLILELDGRAAHQTRSRFDSDRERDRLLVLMGWTVIRASWIQITDRLAADLRELLARAR